LETVCFDAQLARKLIEALAAQEANNCVRHGWFTRRRAFTSASSASWQITHTLGAEFDEILERMMPISETT
jgi:hypothetical protein